MRDAVRCAAWLLRVDRYRQDVFARLVERGPPMLWTIVVILVVLWLLGFLGGIGGGLIHTLLVIAVIIVIYQLITGRRV
jgi:hypothetical protein